MFYHDYCSGNRTQYQYPSEDHFAQGHGSNQGFPSACPFCSALGQENQISKSVQNFLSPPPIIVDPLVRIAKIAGETCLN
uniref:Uncharacterized protein n=1 Tax=Arundo donax TaxID=35708 RepID=A0A0A8XX92_ARUDO